ncbi:MAG: flagellar assembly protein FliX [Asticcacaulis sp.]
MTFKINGPAGPSGVGTPSASRRTSAGGFALGGTGEARSSASAASVSQAMSLGGIDALLALQAEDDVLQGRRRRQIKRSNDILKALEDLKIALLSGDIDDGALLSLQKMIELQREEVEDQGLQGVLNEIETRAYVELAKRKLM